MSSLSVSELLSSWGFEDLIPIFEENEIDMNTMNMLTPETIKELIPKIGPRIRFQEKYSIFKADIVLSINENESIDIFPCHSKNLNDETSTISNVSSPVSTLSDSLLSNYSGDSAGPSDISVNYKNYAIVGLNDDQILSTPIAKHHQTLALKFELEKLLESTNKGRSVLAHYKSFGHLSETMRNKLTDIIIEHYLSGGDPNKRISKKEFDELASGIVGIFPAEAKEIYFATTMKRYSLTKARNIGCGKLFRRYYNIRSQMIKSGLIHSSYANSTLHQCSSQTEFTEDDHEAILWLQNNIEPWTSVIEYWNKSFKLRMEQMKNQELDAFKKFPALKQPLGYTLLEQDFDQLYPDKAMTLYTDFERFGKSIITYIENERRKDKFLIDATKEISASTISEELFIIKILQILPYLFSPITVKKSRGGGFWKPSKVECSEGFIMHVQCIAEIQNKIEQKRNKLATFGLTLQPTPIVVGANFENLTAYYVIVDDHLYQAPTILKAIDLCFKIIHAQHMIYPIEAEQVWLVIQKGLYGIYSKWDKKFSAVSSILSHVGVINP